jgi:hypothetical protein
MSVARDMKMLPRRLRSPFLSLHVVGRHHRVSNDFPSPMEKAGMRAVVSI